MTCREPLKASFPSLEVHGGRHQRLRGVPNPFSSPSEGHMRGPERAESSCEQLRFKQGPVGNVYASGLQKESRGP